MVGCPSRFIQCVPFLVALLLSPTLLASGTPSLDGPLDGPLDGRGFFPRASIGPGYISVPVHGVNHSIPPRTHTLRMKRAPKSAKLENRELFYAVSLWLGTPPQEVVVDLDTGSSELWVNPNCTTASNAKKGQCAVDGRYKPDKSTTPPIGPLEGGTIEYMDGSYVDLIYYNDTLSLGDGAIIPYQRFGAATDSKEMSIGLFGIGPNLKTGFKAHSPYPLVIDSLAQEGITQSRAYSLDLRHYDDPSGSIMYGGIDRGRYIGEFGKVPFVQSSDGHWRLSVTMSSIGVTTSGGTVTEQSLSLAQGNVLLDTGATMSYLYPSYGQQVLSDIDAIENGGFYWAPCELRTQEGSVNFSFNSKMIRVPFSDVIRDENIATNGPEGRCPVGIVLVEEGSLQILGDSFLRAVYVVIDWDNGNAHMAQAASCGSEEIVIISTGTDSVPSAMGLCGATQTASSTKTTSGTSGDGTSASNSIHNPNGDDKVSGSVVMRSGWSMVLLATTFPSIIVLYT